MVKAGVLHPPLFLGGGGRAWDAVVVPKYSLMLATVQHLEFLTFGDIVK